MCLFCVLKESISDKYKNTLQIQFLLLFRQMVHINQVTMNGNGGKEANNVENNVVFIRRPKCTHS